VAVLRFAALTLPQNCHLNPAAELNVRMGTHTENVLMEEIQKAILEFIESDRYSNTTINYDVNSLKLRLYENNSEERCLFFYIYYPWRIVGNGKIFNSSDLYPSEEFSESKEQHKCEFEDYTKSTSELAKQKIVSLAINPITHDLKIEWANGTYLESFTLDSESAQYHIYDNLNFIAHDVSYGNISSRVMQKV
jgi:hypothetical protein